MKPAPPLLPCPLVPDPPGMLADAQAPPPPPEPPVPPTVSPMLPVMAPRPPPVDVTVENTELPPCVAAEPELISVVPEEPPAPTVNVYAVLKTRLVSVPVK